MEKVAIKKNDLLQAFRALLFLNVFFLHAIGELNAYGVTNVVSYFNYLQVTITPFFAMSGFLLMQKDLQLGQSVSIKECFASMWKRISRLYPLHFVTTFFLFLLWCLRYFHGGVLAEKLGRLLLELGFNVFLAQAWSMEPDMANSLNAPAWYLSAAAFLYFVFPLVQKITIRLTGGGRWLLCAAILTLRVLWAGASIKISNMIGSDYFATWACYFFPLFRLADFWIGCLAGRMYYENKERFSLSNFYAGAAQVVAAILGLLYFSINQKSERFLLQAFFDSQIVRVLLSALWVYFFMEGKGLVRFAKVRPLVALGNISGFCYLIHWPVILFQSTVRSFFNIKPSSWTPLLGWGVVLLEFAFTILASVLWSLLSKKLKKK